ncbi:chemotaxis protein CheW [Silvimonas sp. JCM 19000]
MPAATLPATTAGSALPGEDQQYLTFTLGAEVFAVVIHHIKEIIEYSAVTQVPLMPPFVHGVINLRGSVLPVIDLSIRFGRAPTPVGRRTCVVVLNLDFAGEAHSVGMLVDAVNAVIEIPASQIEPAPSFGTPLRAEFIAGMGKINNQFVILLDVAHVLSLEEMSSLVHGAPGAED